MTKSKRQSDAEWYFRHDEDRELFYDIFFKACRKYGIGFASATEKERAFIEEVTRMTFELEKAKRIGTLQRDIKPSFGFTISA